jgi:hypothetical protein
MQRLHAEMRATSLPVYDIKRLTFGMFLFSSSKMSHPVTTQNPATGYVLHVRLIFGVTNSVLFRRALPDALAELKALANIIQSSIEQIEATVTTNSFTYPSPDSTFSLETEAPRMHPAIMSAGSLITSAATQLITLVRPAPLTLFDIMMQVTLSVPSSHGLLLTMWEC